MWALTFEEFLALEARLIAHQDFIEYCAALSPWATINVHRDRNTDAYGPEHFMFRRRKRLEEMAGAAAIPPPPQRGRAAVLLAPVPINGMRYALPGERPPSKFSPGESDGVIERYDAYARAFRAGGVKRYAG